MSQQDIQRAVRLHGFAEQVLRRGLTTEPAILKMFGKVFGAQLPLPRARIVRLAAEDLARFQARVAKDLRNGSRRVSSYQSVCAMLPDGPTYTAQCGLVDAPALDEEWASSIVWHSAVRLELELLAALWPRITKLSNAARRGADYILPLAYTAFLLRDTLGAHAKVTGGIVCYQGGDQLAFER